MSLSKQSATTLLPLALALASCTSTGGASDGASSASSTALSWSAGAYHESTTLDELEVDDPGNVQALLMDESRKRTGVRGSIGIEAARGYFQIFNEQFLDSNDGLGIGIGVEGRPTLHTFDSGLALFLPYRLGANLVANDDVTVAGSKADLAYVEAVFEAGLGARVNGFSPSLGITSKSLAGNLEFAGETDNKYEDDDLRADLVGGYAELAYQRPGSGLRFMLRGLVGGEQGVALGISWDR